MIVLTYIYLCCLGFKGFLYGYPVLGKIEIRIRLISCYTLLNPYPRGSSWAPGRRKGKLKLVGAPSS